MLRMLNLAGKQHVPMLLFCLLLIIATTAIQLMLPMGVKSMLDNVLSGGTQTGLMYLALLLIVFFAVKSVLSYFGQFWLMVTGDRIIVTIREKLFSHYQYLSLAYHKENSVGDLVSRLNNDIAAVRNVVSNVAISFIVSVLQLIGAAAIMFFMDWQLALLVLLLAPATTIVSKIFGRKFFELSKRIQEVLAKSTGTLQESLHGIESVKTFSREPHQIALYQQDMQEFLKRSVKARKADSTYNSIVGFISSMSTISIVWAGGALVLSGDLSAGMLVAFLLYSQYVTQGIVGIAGNYSTLKQAQGASDRVFEILDIDNEQSLTGSVQDSPLHGANLEFSNVAFSYPDEPVFEGINMVVNAGDTVAVTGPSGCGKSTFVKLLPRLYDVTKGRISLNGKDIRDYDITQLRESISIVSQDIHLFASSVMENIRFGNLQASDKEVIKAAQQANADGFIRSLEHGYASLIGANGCKLSGGQRQRIALARAFLKQAPILILDEATSSLDNDNAAYIQGSVESLKARCTTFIIAHNTSTIRSANVVINIADYRNDTAFSDPSNKHIVVGL